MDTVLYLASLATRPGTARGQRNRSIAPHLLAGLMVLLSLALLLQVASGA